MKITAAHSISKHVCQEITNMDSTGRPGRAANTYTLLNTFKKTSVIDDEFPFPFPSTWKQLTIFCSRQHQEMQQIRRPSYERLQRLLWKCQGHLCCSMRVWNEDGECVTLPWEVITGSSKAADHVNFTGHSLVGHYICYSPGLHDTLAPGNECRSGPSLNVLCCDVGEWQQRRRWW